MNLSVDCVQTKAEHHEMSQQASYRVLAITLFFLGCWFTGLPAAVLVLTEPFLACSLCLSGETPEHRERTSVRAATQAETHRMLAQQDKPKLDKSQQKIDFLLNGKTAPQSEIGRASCRERV